MKNMKYLTMGLFFALLFGVAACAGTKTDTSATPSGNGSAPAATSAATTAASPAVTTAVDSLAPTTNVAQQTQQAQQLQNNAPAYQSSRGRGGRGGNYGGGISGGGREKPAYLKDPAAQPPAPPAARNRIQVALLLDTSSSMDGLIEQAKSQLWKMVNELAKAEKEGEAPQVELALFEYGNDWLESEVGHIRQISRLTIDLDWASTQLFQLLTNGGAEYCGWVIKDAFEGLEWSDNPNDLKIIFIAGNEEFTQGKVDYKKICQKAKENGILVNTIHCGDNETGIKGFWKDGSVIGGGRYMNIDMGEAVVHIPTPYDDKVLELNKKLNETYIGYGSGGASRKEMQVAQDAAASQYSSANTRTRAFYKGKSNYKNTSWDLVDATEEDCDKVLKDLKKGDLPKEMQDMTLEERKAYIEKKRKERKEIQAELLELEKKVEAYVAEERKKMSETNTLDNAMLDAIKEQAVAKGFKFE